ncbi:MAG: carbon-monoxide dehydrogenase large subunit [Candidatus Poriferisodalaceae bacterium]
MSILGNRVVRLEDPRFLRGDATFVENLDLPEAAHLVYVRSTVANGTIAEIDIADALVAPGIVAIFTGADVEDALGKAPPVLPIFPEEVLRPFVANGTVRYVGEPLVAVIAETRALAMDAAEMVIVDYEFLPAVVDLEEAAADVVVLHPDLGTNVLSVNKTDEEANFDDCEVVVAERINNQRLSGAPIEPRSGAARWTADGRLEHWSACQGAHPTRDLLSKIMGLETDQVRVVVPDVGGSFGAKSRTYPEELVLGWYSKQIGRPVTWTESRSENVQAMPQGRGQLQFARLGGTRDGRITAYQLDVIQDAGAYPLIGAILAGMTRRMLCGTYDITNVGFCATTVLTSKVSITAYRGAGRPEACVAIERMIDRFADEIGMDPADVRRINLIPRFVEPYTTGIGTAYDVGDYPESLRLALDAVGYDDLLAEQAERRAGGSNLLMGIGIGMYVEVTAGGPGSEFGAVELNPSGRITVRSGTTAFGQGHQTTWAMLVADRTGVAMDDIDVVQGDTDVVSRGALTVGSRSVQLGGSAIAAATTQLVAAAKDRAANLLEAAADDIELDADSGRFHVAGTPAVAVTWAEVAEGLEAAIVEEHDFAAAMPTFPSGCHIAVVEVDAETGGTELLRLLAVDDAGVILNPLVADGQILGGMVQGAAQVLFEEIQYDEDGNIVTSTFMDYLVPSAAEVPSFDLVHQETPTWVNELGAKGVGESGTVGAIPAVYNAVIDAISHRGVTHLETPLTPQKVWMALAAQAE